MTLLPETVARIDDVVMSAQAAGRVPSLAVGVVRGGSVLHLSTAGELPEPGADTQYRIGSITKTITAALVLALRDEGALGLDDLLYRHLPGTPVGTVTIRQLLGHVSGLQREPDGQWWERSAGRDLDSFLAELTPDKIAYPPNRNFHYSNLSYGLLGAVASRVTGQPWADLVRERLCEPLGMGRTTYHAAEPFARGYVVHPWHDTLREEPRHDAGAMAPAGQLWSTVDDMARWASLLSGTAEVLPAATVAEMTAPLAIFDPDRWTEGYGMGVRIWRRGERVYCGHTGSMPGYRSFLAVHRPTGTGVVAFVNGYTLYRRSLADVGLAILDDVVDRTHAPVPVWRPGTTPPAEAEPLTGRWWWMGQEFQASWDSTARELVFEPLTVPGQPTRFVPDGADRWRGRTGDHDGEVLRVRRTRSGVVTSLDIATHVFTRDPSEGGTPY